MKIEFLDGNVQEFQEACNMFVIAKSISNSLAKKAVAAKIDGELYDMSYILDHDAKVEFIMPESEEGVEVIRHSAAHLMAQAVIRLFPGTKVTIGPSIENGFYYDFDPKEQFTEEDLLKIEEEMKKLSKEDIKVERFMMSREEAIEYFEKLGEHYKVEIIKDIAKGEQLSFYRQGEFVDLCRGPHVPSTGHIKAIKLKSVAGAYWRGDSKNKMLQRIYGYAFATEKDLKDFLQLMEEAEKRDHRKLGKELELFFLSEYGPGFPFFLPKGMVLRNTLIDLWRAEHEKAGYVQIDTPIMLNRELWEISGHWFNYRENMYTSSIDDVDFAIKPMNCPGGVLAFKYQQHSYRDLPARVAELGKVHRHEFSGALHGLFRVRAFTQDDSHIFMTEEQIESEIIGVVNLIDKFYSKLFGFQYSIELSTRPEKSIGTDEIWEKAEAALAGALHHLGREFKINEGDGAFYGPKLDFKIKDAIGRTWQCGTIQLDFNLPERFDVTYVGEDGEKHRPVMIHRVIYGSIERFIGILIEHYAGAFPMWLAPVQIKVLTINDDCVSYAKEVVEALKGQGIRAELDDRSESIGYKIREANGRYKIPMQVIIGKNEIEKREVNIRRFGSQAQESMDLNAFLSLVVEEAKIRFQD
ncbi:threonine--tRNA ligase [Fusobacterium necrophorum]|uniref:Threonine--tRNA ligase n=1 Tax=Fusobacterium necrophorum BL TaxID=1441732 RepID=A0AB73BZB9_9FUSO|nr:threonine--tRNA ligase [Fusobacterium necrophorum]AYZ73956.1 threonine--tRNA ligase [Fusobacterium necrophorum]AZW10166.1 threonine--tRNA ligase [Fusobacterium necrophorum subsp. necrophorum]KDE64257.1 threonyl-tRNA synthetase [Fusobacterium necrophorum BFTR-1]KDE65669.1 threonyl-tRNA synthetase [Fusobacterium necrophorum BL]MBR8732683.1 Threonine--tRNA ligase 2 [Fusobacterium necrophorum]